VNSLPLFEFRTPSASIDLRHAAKESFSDRGCSPAAAGPEPGDPFSSRGPKPEEEGHQSNAQEDDLDQEIRNMEMLHEQVQRKKEKMARLADLQRQIDEASEEVRHLAQDEQNRRPQHRELHQEGFFNEDDWYEDFHHGNFAFDDASLLSAEL
jgi:TolA-binding protein